MSLTPTSPPQVAAAAWPAPGDAVQFKSNKLSTGGVSRKGWSSRSVPNMVTRSSKGVDSATDTTILASMVKTVSVPLTNEDKMQELISLQTFDGSWKWTTKLFVVLDVDEEKVKVVLAGVDKTVMATVLAVGFLEGKMPEEEGVWEMVVEKRKAG